MKVRHFVVDETGKLRRAKQSAVRGLWDGDDGVAGYDGVCDVLLVTALLTDSLVPFSIGYVRVEMVDGFVDEDEKVAPAA